jgi:hypothetical protein
MGMSAILSNQGHARSFGSWINFHINRLNTAFCSDPVNESDGEWKHLVNPGPALSQEFSCPGWMTRH